jgi:hypothetical protein
MFGLRFETKVVSMHVRTTKGRGKESARLSTKAAPLLAIGIAFVCGACSGSADVEDSLHLDASADVEQFVDAEVEDSRPPLDANNAGDSSDADAHIDDATDGTDDTVDTDGSEGDDAAHLDGGADTLEPADVEDLDDVIDPIFEPEGDWTHCAAMGWQANEDGEGEETILDRSMRWDAGGRLRGMDETFDGMRTERTWAWDRHDRLVGESRVRWGGDPLRVQDQFERTTQWDDEPPSVARRTREVEVNSRGRVRVTYKRYDDADQQREERVEDDEGNVLIELRWIVLPSGLLVESWSDYDGDGVPEEEMIETVVDGLVVRVDTVGLRPATRTYTYDDEGRLLDEVYTEDGETEPSRISRRTWVSSTDYEVVRYAGDGVTPHGGQLWEFTPDGVRTRLDGFNAERQCSTSNTLYAPDTGWMLREDRRTLVDTNPLTCLANWRDETGERSQRILREFDTAGRFVSVRWQEQRANHWTREDVRVWGEEIYVERRLVERASTGTLIAEETFFGEETFDDEGRVIAWTRDEPEGTQTWRERVYAPGGGVAVERSGTRGGARSHERRLDQEFDDAARLISVAESTGEGPSPTAIVLAPRRRVDYTWDGDAPTTTCWGEDSTEEPALWW